jgi:hypothetical protein
MYSSKKIEKSILRDFSLARLGASAINVDAVCPDECCSAELWLTVWIYR